MEATGFTKERPLGSPLPSNPTVFLDLSLLDASSKEVKAGRLELELRADIAPQAAEAFRHLCVSDPPDWSYKQLLMPRMKYHFGIPGVHPLTGESIADGIEVWGGELSNDCYYLLHITEGVLYLKNGVDADSFYTQIYWCNDPVPNAHKDVKVGQVTSDRVSLLKDVDFFGSMFNTTTGAPAFSVGVSDCGQLHQDLGSVDAASSSGNGWGAVMAPGGRHTHHHSSSSSSGRRQQQQRRRSGSWLGRQSLMPSLLQPAHAVAAGTQRPYSGCTPVAAPPLHSSSSSSLTAAAPRIRGSSSRISVMAAVAATRALPAARSFRAAAAASGAKRAMPCSLW